MDILVKLAENTDISSYTKLLQRTYVKTYVNEKLGLTKECFSEEIFNNPLTQDYLLSNLQNNINQYAWLALNGDKLVGSITVKVGEKESEITGFYVAPECQGQGVGRKLYQKALKIIGDKEVVIDLYAHSTKSFEMYIKWGFKVDETRGDKGYFYRHWDEWPNDLKAKCVYMRLTNRKKV